MILASNRVPGQLLPVGARYWYNAGSPINALEALSGKDTYLAPSVGATAGQVAAATAIGRVIAGLAGYYVTKKVAGPSQKGAGAIGALTGAFLGAPGVALSVYIYSK